MGQRKNRKGWRLSLTGEVVPKRGHSPNVVHARALRFFRKALPSVHARNEECKGCPGFAVFETSDGLFIQKDDSSCGFDGPKTDHEAILLALRAVKKHDDARRLKCHD